MFRLFVSILLFLSAGVTVAHAEPQNIKDALSRLAGGKSDTTQSKSGGLLDAIGGLFGGKTKIADMVGTWQYKSPAVSFKSDNLLKKAGGAAASAVVENTLAPVYRTTGFDRMVFTVAADSSFTMKVKMVTLKGKITTDVPKGSEANFMFDFKIAGKMSIGKMEAYVSKSGNNLSLTFDVTKLMNLISKAGSISGNSSLKTLSKLLESYDGMCAGFELRKSAE